MHSLFCSASKGLNFLLYQLPWFTRTRPIPAAEAQQLSRTGGGVTRTRSASGSGISVPCALCGAARNRCPPAVSLGPQLRGGQATIIPAPGTAVWSPHRNCSPSVAGTNNPGSGSACGRRGHGRCQHPRLSRSHLPGTGRGYPGADPVIAAVQQLSPTIPANGTPTHF